MIKKIELSLKQTIRFTSVNILACFFITLFTACLLDNTIIFDIIWPMDYYIMYKPSKIWSRRICESNGFNHLYTHRGKTSIEFLKKHNMYEYFSGLITRDSNFKRKPNPEALLWLTEEYKIDKSEALMIGDRDIDILAAKNAGIEGCYYKSYPLYDCKFAKYMITDYSQLAELLAL